MCDKCSKWIAALEEIKTNILNTLNYNGLILDNIDKLINDIQETQEQ
jgi:hypothetical protein